jgi:hypothetical protein
MERRIITEDLYVTPRGLHANRNIIASQVRPLAEYTGILLRKSSYPSNILPGQTIIFSNFTINSQIKEGVVDPIYAIHAPLDNNHPLAFSTHSSTEPNSIIKEAEINEYSRNDSRFYKMYLFVIHPLNKGELIQWAYEDEYRNLYGYVEKSD